MQAVITEAVLPREPITSKKYCEWLLADKLKNRRTIVKPSLGARNRGQNILISGEWPEYHLQKVENWKNLKDHNCRPNEKPHYLHFWSKLSFLYRQIRKKISYLMAQTEFWKSF